MNALETEMLLPLNPKATLLSAVMKRAILIRFVWKSFGYNHKIDAFSYSPLKKKKNLTYLSITDVSESV